MRRSLKARWMGSVGLHAGVDRTPVGGQSVPLWVCCYTDLDDVRSGPRKYQRVGSLRHDIPFRDSYL
jgi:hypothetical protein